MKPIKLWNYCAQLWRYYCQCNMFNPIEVVPGEPCPSCGSIHHPDDFREAGI